MELAKNNNLIVNNSKSITRTKPLSFDIGMCLIYTALIVLGMFNNIGSLAAFVLIVVAFYWLPLENIICQMMYLMSFAAVFKMSPASTSLLTIIELYVVLLMIWRRPVFKTKEVFALVLLSLSILTGLLFNYNLQILLTIKFIVSMFLVMGFKNADFQKELPNFIVIFAIGLIMSSIIGFYGMDVPQIFSYMRADRLVESSWQGSYVTDTIRFCGLNSDPNYYSINLFMAMLGILVLDENGVYKNKLILYSGIFILFFFGLQTVSKSFAFMTLVIFLYLLFVAIKKQNTMMVVFLLIVALIVVVLTISKKSELINTMLNRISESFADNDITTGRTHIWSKYFEYFFKNPIISVFGAGLGYGFGGLGAAHNTYIEVLTCLGVVGTILFIVFVFLLFQGKEKGFIRRLENYSLLIIVLVMYAFLSMLTWVDLPIHLFLCYCFFYYDFGNSKVKEKKYAV